MNSLRALIAFVLLTVTFREGFALKCWRCSSDAKNGEFCHDPFSPDKVSETRLKYNFVECKEPTESDKVAVCKKLVSNIRDKVVVKRTCAIESRTEVGEECAPVDTPSYVKTVFCETCRTDGCNANIATDYFALEDEFPLDELRKIQSQAPALEDHNTSVFDVDNGEEDDEEDDDAEDNDIARDAGRRGSLVTHQDHRTETVHHAVDPELTQNGNSAAETTMIFSTLSLVSSTMLAIYLSH